MKSSFAPDVLAGRRAVVTGGGTGIGLAVAEALSRHGAAVALASRDAERLGREASGLAARTGGRVLAAPVDVADERSVKDLFKRLDAELGPVDILVNGAAANFVRPSEALTPVRMRKVVDIVLHGSFHCALEAGRRMLARGEGCIVNLLASYAWTGGPGFLPSACAKGGVLAMTKTLGVEWGARGVRVNAVSPGLVDTPQSRERLWPEEWMREALAEWSPSRRFGGPQETADAVLFLASPAGAGVSGEILGVDGGAATGGVPYLRFLEKAGTVRRARAKGEG